MRVVQMVLAGVVLTGVTVLAEEEQKPERKRPTAEERFAAADTDGNGTVSLEEFKVVHAKRLEAHKKRMGDRYDAERAAKMPSADETFKRLDTDGNGALTQEEMSKGHRRGRGERPNRAAKKEGDE